MNTLKEPFLFIQSCPTTTVGQNFVAFRCDSRYGLSELGEMLSSALNNEKKPIKINLANRPVYELLKKNTEIADVDCTFVENIQICEVPAQGEEELSVDLDESVLVMRLSSVGLKFLIERCRLLYDVWRDKEIFTEMPSIPLPLDRDFKEKSGVSVLAIFAFQNEKNIYSFAQIQ